MTSARTALSYWSSSWFILPAVPMGVPFASSHVTSHWYVPSGTEPWGSCADVAEVRRSCTGAARLPAL